MAQPQRSATRPAQVPESEWGEPVPSREFFQWDSVGKSLVGSIIELIPSDKFEDGKRLRILTADGMVMVSSPTKLTQLIEDNALVGARVKITYVGDVPTGRGQQMKDFVVQTSKRQPEPSTITNVPF
jgi:hypothetical protein